MLAARITLAYFSVSSAMSFAKSAGEPASNMPTQVGKPRLPGRWAMPPRCPDCPL